jgi:hypothetical protein
MNLAKCRVCCKIKLRMDSPLVVSVRRIAEWLLATVGAAVCIGTAILFWLEQSSFPGASLWPLPALVLIEVAFLGLAGISAVVLIGDEHTSQWGSLIWAVSGGLTALTVIGGFSIGPLLVWAVLAFVLAGVLIDWRIGRKILYDLGIFTLGTVCNAAILLLLIVAAGSLR